jgi:hypothetical protein
MLLRTAALLHMLALASGWGKLQAIEEQRNINWTYSHGQFNYTLPESARERSVRNLGKSPRFRAFLRKLSAGEPVRVVAFGGSVTSGNGLSPAYHRSHRFSGVFEAWLNAHFPVTKPLLTGDPGFADRHVVVNKAVSASGTCFLARTVRAEALVPV